MDSDIKALLTCPDGITISLKHKKSASHNPESAHQSVIALVQQLARAAAEDDYQTYRTSIDTKPRRHQ